MDRVTAKWFADASVTVHRAPSLEGFMTDAQLARIAGAPRDSIVNVYPDGGGIALRVDNRILAEPMYRYLFQNPGPPYSFHLRNVVLVLADEYTQAGIGTRCVVRQIIEAASWARAGIYLTDVRVSAVGDLATFGLKPHPMRGYYVWPALGFDAFIPASSAVRLCQPYQNCTRISELMTTAEGRKTWRLIGQSVDLSFDLKPGSASWRQLLSYMQAKGISL
ncbi:hypothetical protein E4L96_02040 [Massilia arenosa]|uniref:Uncharacterized protein n=1 Tax=Zemynaea arenosa TaxID=2561931 RepID=A0A4Y9SPP0_9BURK|nr:hypothetical protein [Massilia arenosa]TFW28742.1 hypothetical protein E4L96_02040 [Massilia arenosa]